MPIAAKTVRAVVWNLGSSVGTRALTLLGTVVLTRFVAPQAYGEVMVAAMLVVTAKDLTGLGVSPYVAARPAGSAELFHVTVIYLTVSVVVFAAVVAARGWAARIFDAPQIAAFIPGLALASLIERLAVIPEGLLVREMRFRRWSVIRSLAELAYTVLALAVAVAGGGAWAVVAGNLGRGLTLGLMALTSVDRRVWLAPCRLRWTTISEIVRFAAPAWLSGVAANAAVRWDNLLIAKIFGPASAGLYALAYRVAELPAAHVGEPVAHVLLPSFVRTSPADRPEAFRRALGVMGMLAFPAAIGLACIAPTVTAVLLDAKWQALAPLLVILSGISVARPVGEIVRSYLQAVNRPSLAMRLELRVVLLVCGLIATVGRFDVQVACVCVTIAWVSYALACLRAVARHDDVPLMTLLAALRAPLGACLPMALAIWVARDWLAIRGAPLVGVLAVEVAVGVAAYALTMAVLDLATLRALGRIAVDALGKRGGPVS